MRMPTNKNICLYAQRSAWHLAQKNSLLACLKIDCCELGQRVEETLRLSIVYIA